MKKSVLAAAAALVATTGIASAHGINQKQANQYSRIEQGRQTGKITWTEGLKLRAEQKRIAHLEALYRSDGYLSPSERRQLRATQNNASEHIAHEKHDGWKRAWWMPRFGH